MIHIATVSQEIDRVVSATSSTCVALAGIADEIRAVMTQERHDVDLTSKVVASHAKRAALALTTIAGLAGKLELLALLEAGGL
jgi:hypothetical protein